MSINWTPLIRAAQEVRLYAYAPYSKLMVGAAVLTSTGQMFTGCNVENASYGLSLCAERSAMAQAISAGHRDIVAIAVCGDSLLTPCGACRQFILEFGTDIAILSFDATDPANSLQATAQSLLPAPFTLS